MNAGGELRIDADAHVAGVVRVAVVEQVLKAERTADRQIPVLGKALQRRASLARPAAAAGDHEGPLRFDQQRTQVAQRARRGPGLRGLGARQHRCTCGLRQHVFRQHQHHWARAALQRGVEGSRDVLGQAVRVVYLGHPLREAQRAGTEHLAVVDLLEGLAIALVARHLADEEDHRRRILEGGVQADARVGGTGAARHEADAGAARELALRLGHEGRAALLPAGDEADLAAMLVEAVEHREIALAGHAEDGIDTLRDQRLDQGMAGQAGRLPIRCLVHPATVAGARSDLAATPMPTSAAEATPNTSAPAAP